MGLFLTAVPFIYVAIGVFYGPVAVFFRVINFIKFRKHDDGGERPEAPGRRTETDPNANLYGYMRPGPEYNFYHGSSAGQIFGSLAAGAVILIALMGLTLLFGGGEAFLFAALGAYIVPAFAFAFDMASIWGKRRTKAENQALVDGITGVRVRYVILALSWAIGIVGSYWLAIWFFIAGGPSSLF